MIKEFMQLLKNIPVDKNAIGIEGVPFAGKTFYIQENFNNSKFYNINEHMLFKSSLPDFVEFRWSLVLEDVLKRQKYFLDLEMERWYNAIKFETKIKVFDRTILSVVAYLYARLASSNDKNSIWTAFLELLATYIDAGKIKIPANLIWIDTNYSLIKQRSEDNKRRCEPFLLKELTFDALRDFYKEIFSDTSNHFKTDIIESENICPN